VYLAHVLTKKQKEKQRKSLLFQRIKQIFNNREVKELSEQLPTEISNYFVAKDPMLNSFVFVVFYYIYTG
jgi:hypothetical protein